MEGFDIREDMRHVYGIMGVCPQHDLLWEQLTGREHLRFYGRLKGLTGKVGATGSRLPGGGPWARVRERLKYVCGSWMGPQ